MLVRMVGTGKVLRGLTPEQASEIAAKWGANNPRVQIVAEAEDIPEASTRPVSMYDVWQFGPTADEAAALEQECRGKFRQVVHCTMKQLQRAIR